MKKLHLRGITEKAKYWFIAPVVIFLIAVIAFISYAVYYKDTGKGMNIGTDFAGGTVVTVVLGEGKIGNDDGYKNYSEQIQGIITSEEIAKQVAEYARNDLKIEIPESACMSSVSYTQRSDSGDAMGIQIKYDNISKTYDASNTLTTYRNDLIQRAIEVVYDSDTEEYRDVEVSYSNIGASASQKLINRALLATAITMVLILIYVIIRFELWSAIAAIIALIHDVAMIFCLTIIFHIQINSSFIAALITIVAYSINNTIVVFDRVRENNRNAKKSNSSVPLNTIVNNSIDATLQRSINSTLTTLVSITLFAILGSASVREFALPVIFGLICGFYSSLVLAPSLYCMMKNTSLSMKKKDAKNFSYKSSKKKA